MLAPEAPAADEVCNGSGPAPLLLLCDHATRFLLRGFGTRALSEAELQRHIAWDIGIAEVRRALANVLIEVRQDLIDTPHGAAEWTGRLGKALCQRSLIMTPRDRAGDPPGRREAAGDAGHRQGFPTPAGGSPARPERRLPKAFGRRPARLAMPRIAAPCVPGRKPWEAVSMGQFQRPLGLAVVLKSSGVVAAVRQG
ncbi:MAG: hypothetical protein V3S27_10640 [Kiloniellales bacterium]